MLHDKVVIVTGASSGIGAAATRLFAAEGAHLVVAARRGDRLGELAAELRSAGHAVEPVVADMASTADVDATVARALSMYGRLDGAFNNAGVTYLGACRLADVAEADVQRLLEVNLVGVWRCIAAQVRGMRLSGGGSIVNNSSVGGILAGAGLGPYSASKHGVVGLTRTAAADHADEGIRVNALAPGGTNSEMIDQWETVVPDLRARIDASNPQQRRGEPGEVAEAACWLLSDRASFVTGVVLPVDGGFSMT